MLGALTLPDISSPDELIPTTGTDMVLMDNDSQGNDLQPMSPMESMMAIFTEIRDGINTLVELAYGGSTEGGVLNDARDEGIAAADVPTEVEETDSQGNEGGFLKNFKVPEVGPKLGLALLLGGLAALLKFGDKLVPIIAPVLKFIKEKALPFAIDAVKMAFEGIKTVFMYLYDNVWPFIKDNIILNAVDFVKESFQGIVDLFGDLKERFSVLFSEDATWWEKITAFLGIFGDIGKFFIEQFDRVTEFIANVFGVSFAPYDGLISYVSGKLTEGFKVVTDWFSETGTFLLEGASGIFDFVSGKVSDAFEAVKTFFGFGDDDMSGDPPFSITDFIVDTAKNLFDKITSFFSFDNFGVEIPPLPNIGDLFMNFIGGLLPSPDSLLGKAIYKIPGTGKLEEAATIFAAGGTIEGGVMTMSTPEETFGSQSGATLQENSETLREGLENSLDRQEKIANVFGRNSLEYEQEVMRFNAIENKLAEIEKERMDREATGNVVTNITTTDASNTNNTQNNTTQTGNLSVEGTDTTARYLAAAGLA